MPSLALNKSHRRIVASAPLAVAAAAMLRAQQPPPPSHSRSFERPN
jgi:hypothetical protein